MYTSALWATKKHSEDGALTVNIHTPDKFEAADFAFLHEFIASTFPEKRTLKYRASRDL